MKQLTILLLSFFLSPVFGSAQIWVQPNAVWHYDYWTVGYSGFVKIQHIGDIVIQGKSTMMFESKDYQFYTDQFGETFLAGPYVIDTNYTYSDGDTVFYFQNNQFFKLFDFSQTMGNSYNIGVTNGNDMCSSTSNTEVIGAGVDGLGYNYFTLNSPDTSDLRLYGNYNTRFGGGEFLFPRRFWCDPSIIVEYYNFTFKCFQDDGMVYNPSGEDCEYQLTHLDLNEWEKELVQIFPNPTNEKISFKSIDKNVAIEIVDLKGQVLFQESWNLSNDLDVSFLKPGFHILKITSEDSKETKLRFLKE